MNNSVFWNSNIILQVKLAAITRLFSLEVALNQVIWLVNYNVRQRSNCGKSYAQEKEKNPFFQLG